LKKRKAIVAATMLLLVIVSAGLFGNKLLNKGNIQQISYTNPVFDHDAPDPSVIKAKDGFYYAITSKSPYEGEVERVVPILKSADLVSWERVGEVFPELPEWINKEAAEFWAPDLVVHNDKYYVYYASLVKNNDHETGFGIGVAVADDLLGPYVDKGEPLVTGVSFSTIDAMVFTDTDGKRYMYWGSAFKPILAQQLSDDGLSLIGEPKEVLFPTFGTVVDIDTGEAVKDNYEGLVEGPWVIKRGDTYYMFYSGDNCCIDKPHYAVLVAKSSSPWGPFERYEKGNPILAANEKYNAPGHNAIIQDDGGQDWILYHAYDRSNPDKGRIMLLDKVKWENGWPVINDGKGPSFTQQNEGPMITK
jgi:arabinan endo-1,5-alpha-L-arabinosidase